MNGPPAAVARPWFPSPRHNTHTQTLAAPGAPDAAEPEPPMPQSPREPMPQQKKGLQVVFVDPCPMTTTDFSAILTKVRAANPDVLGGATLFEDAVAITRQLKALNVNPRMVGLTMGVELPKFSQAAPALALSLGRFAACRCSLSNGQLSIGGLTA